MSKPTLDELIAQYLAAIDAGEDPERERLMADHPEHADGLRKFFADFDRMRGAVERAEDEATREFVAQENERHDGSLPQEENTSLSKLSDETQQRLERLLHKLQENQAKDLGLGKTVDSSKSGASRVIDGKYKLLQQIGSGGMGEVWMAEQAKPVKRRVAIKLIKAGMDSKAVLARFDAERQALALMNHANIAKVFDAGMINAEDQTVGVGRPFFAMELVRGIPITEYCDSRRLEIRERLKLFRQCCSAVHHAHQKGIIHRDLKPSNVLVESHDDEPVLKVIDFGLAKAIGGTQLTEQTLFTAMGTVAGTPLYMAPEQAVLNALDIDIRADVFSLGVLLYELMTGTTPLTSETFKEKGLDELLKLIREYEPPSPSQRVSSSETLANIAALRQIEPRRLGRFVRGELDWISMKALAKERERRYGSALALSEDIDRYLNEEPVQASPPSTAYQLAKFAKKHRGLVLTSAAIVTTMVLGILGVGWGIVKADQAKADAIAAKESAQSERDQKHEALRSEELQRIAAEKHLAASIIRPIGNYPYDPDMTGLGHLRNVELESLAQWALLEAPVLRVQILRYAFDKPESAAHVANRAELVIQAVSGTDPTTHGLLVDLIEELAAKGEYSVQFAVLRFATLLGTTKTLQVAGLIEHPSLNLARFRTEIFSPFLKLNQLTQDDATVLWNALENRTQNTQVDVDYEEVASLMDSLIPSLPQTEIGNCYQCLVQVYADCDFFWGFSEVDNGLVALARRMDESQVNETIRFIERQRKARSFEMVAHALGGLVPVLQGSNVKWAWEHLCELRGEQSIQGIIREGLVRLAKRTDTEDVPTAVKILLESVDAESYEDLLSWDVRACLDEFSASLAPQTASQLLRRLLSATIDVSEREDYESICWFLEAISDGLEGAEVTLAFSKLVEISELRWHDFGVEYAASAIASYGPQLNEDQIVTAWRAIIAQGETANELDGGLETARDSLASLSPLIPESRIDACLNTALELTRNDATEGFACAALGAIAPRLSQEELTLSWKHLVDIGNKNSLTWHWTEIDSVASNMDLPLAFTTFDTLIRQLDADELPNRNEAIESQLVALVPKLDAKRARAALPFFESMTGFTVTDFTSSRSRERLANAISAIIRQQDTHTQLKMLSMFLGRPKETGFFADERNLGLAVFAKTLASQNENGVGQLALPLLDQLWKDSKNLHQVEREIAEILQLQAPTLDSEQGDVAYSLIRELISNVADENSCESLTIAVLGLRRVLKPSQFTKLSAMIMQKELESQVIVKRGWLESQEYPERAVSMLLVHTVDPALILDWLRKPGAAGRLGDCFLARLEELLLYDGDTVFSELMSQWPAREWDQLDPSAQSDWLAKRRALPPRRFATIGRAVRWIVVNRPDLDLNAPYVPEDYQLAP